MIRHAFDYIKKHPSLWLLIIPAFVMHMLIMMPSGTNMCLGDRCGIHFWGIHSHDAMWHLEIAAASFQSFPFKVPTYAGVDLSGYNILMDYLLYLLSLIGIPPLFSLFKIVPVVWFAFYTLIGVAVAKKIRDSFVFVILTLFLLYFADHFGYILQLYHQGSILKGSQSFYLQSLTSLLNTQYALTLPLLLLQLYYLLDKKYTLRRALIMGILSSVIVSLKFYGGVISIVLSGFYLLDSLILTRKLKETVLYGSIIGSCIMIAVIFFYNPFEASTTGSVFTFSPFATVHSVIEEQDMVYSADMVNARYFLYSHGWSPRLVYIELYSTLLYFVINFGTRIFGIAYIGWNIVRKKNSKIELYILTAALIAFSLNVLLIQKGDWWNTVQFGYYGTFLSVFLLARLLTDLFTSKNKIGIFIAVLIIFLTIPSALKTIYGFGNMKTLYISKGEVDAMNFLKKQPKGVVFNSFEAPNGYSFLDYRTSGYVSAFTGKQLYLAHLGPLNIIGVDTSKRLNRINMKDCTVFNEVDYIYYVKGHNDSILKKCKITIKQSFVSIVNNSEVTILGKK